MIQIEFTIYNTLRYVFAHLPKPLKQYSASTNLLAVRRRYLKKLEALMLMKSMLMVCWEEHYVTVEKCFSHLLELRLINHRGGFKEMGFLEFNATSSTYWRIFSPSYLERD